MQLPESLVLIWTVLGETADTSNLGTADLSTLPTAFVNAVFGAGTPQYATNNYAVTLDLNVGTNGTLSLSDGVYGGPLLPGDNIKQNETYVFDVSDSSMAGIEFGFSASADNSVIMR